MTLFYDLKQLNFVKSDKQCCMDSFQTVSLHLSNTFHCTPEVFFLVIKKEKERNVLSEKDNNPSWCTQIECPRVL